jgi:hypothetical protein
MRGELMRGSADPQHLHDLINYWSSWYDVNPRLARAVFRQESDLNPRIADSSTGAQGLAQLMPETQRHLGVTDPYDPNQAIRGGIQYLREGLEAAAARGQDLASGTVGHYNPGGGQAYVDAVARRYMADRPGDVETAPTARVPQSSVQGGGLAPAMPGMPAARFGVSSEAQQTLSHVDPRLVDILTRASGYLPDGWKAELSSGYRPGDPRFHGVGLAADVRLYDDQGNAIPEYQNSGTFRMYEQYAQAAKKIQSTLYPELDPHFAWGGYFYSGGWQPGGKLAYGAADQEHFDLGGPRGEAGDWQNGLNQTGRLAGYDRFGGASVGMGPIAQYRLPGQGNVATQPSPAGTVTATSLPDTAAPGLVSSPTQPVYNEATGKFEQRPRPGAPQPISPAPSPAASPSTIPPPPPPKPPVPSQAAAAAAPAPSPEPAPSQVAMPSRVLAQSDIDLMAPVAAALAGLRTDLTVEDRKALAAHLEAAQPPAEPAPNISPNISPTISPNISPAPAAAP